VKGQYLAIESVLTLGIGLAMAAGTIAMVNDYQSQLLNTNQAAQIDIIESKVINAVYTLESADSGEVTVNIPRRIGEETYRIAFNNGLKIRYDGETYSNGFNNLEHDYSFSGVSRGGPVKVFKKQDEYILRAD
jgi:hypothetical protein